VRDRGIDRGGLRQRMGWGGHERARGLRNPEKSFWTLAETG